jgi:superfamily II RNA helicase
MTAVIKKDEAESDLLREFEPKKIKDDDPNNYLTVDEMAQLNLNNERYKVFERDKKIIDLQFRLIQLQGEVNMAKMQVLEKDRAILNSTSKMLAQEFEAHKIGNKELIKNIARRHGIKSTDGFGYDPESGKIIVDG